VIGAAHTLESLQCAVDEQRLTSLCISPFSSLAHLPDVPLADSGVAKVSFGRSPLWNDTRIQGDDVPVGTELVRLSHDGILIAVARLVESGDSVAAIVLKRVFM
jgi:hypothetical protein